VGTEETEVIEEAEHEEAKVLKQKTWWRHDPAEFFLAEQDEE
jgi:hypothetical protein